MKHLPAALLGGLTTLIATMAPVWASGPQGLFEVCRSPAVVTLYDHQAIPLPAGTTFADVADLHERDANGGGRPVRVVLLEPVTIPQSGKCAVAHAMVTMNPRGFPLGPSEHRAYRLSGSFRGSAPELVGQARSDFR